jgi:predicted GNAT family acetyltransferase
MELQQKEDYPNGIYSLEEDGQVLAEAFYTWNAPDHLVITYVRVMPALQGRGLGQDMVHRMVEVARAKQAQLSATCGYARWVLQGMDSK